MSVCFLEEDSMIAGSRKTMVFDVYDESGSLLNISGAKVVFCPYGEYSTTSLEKTGTVNPATRFTITFTPEDTISLSGVYSFQTIVVDTSGNRFRDCEGDMVISPAIREN
ncbi:hypothetical protein M0R04_15850 [Candidatus Dojkabacteria bacterium]|jgi:hypothetical protein|nr:hypothetical protein [Candidatus Dojkabacteria bacterium]